MLYFDAKTAIYFIFSMSRTGVCIDSTECPNKMSPYTNHS